MINEQKLSLTLFLKIPLRINFGFALDLVLIASIVKQTLLLYADCSLTLARNTKRTSIFFKAWYYTTEASNIAMILTINPMFLFLTTCRVGHILIDFNVITYIKLRHDIKKRSVLT